MESINIKQHYLKIVSALNVTLGLFLIIVLWFFVRNIITVVQKKDMKSVSVAPIASMKQENKDIKEYETLLQTNPFGVSAGSLKRGPSQGVQTSNPEIKLVGTISGNDEYGYAVFIGSDGKQAMFKTGENVFGSGELKKVEKNSVVIHKDGKLIKVDMTDLFTLSNTQISKAATGIAGSVQSVGKGEYIIDQKAALVTLDNPAQIMTDAKLIPNMVNGKPDGFILQEIRKNGVYDNLGLKNGDILLRINDSSISNPENALQTFMALKGMDKVQLDIIRDGNRTTLNYQIR
ncbi:MAG TPA: type II secretion system protein N [Syntrophales bacterium]|nr:type II secretion system protein N [Syntrophales bacterium]